MSHLILTKGFEHTCDVMLVFDKEKRPPEGDRSRSGSLRCGVSGPCWSAAPRHPCQACRMQAAVEGGVHLGSTCPETSDNTSNLSKDFQGVVFCSHIR